MLVLKYDKNLSLSNIKNLMSFLLSLKVNYLEEFHDKLEN